MLTETTVYITIPSTPENDADTLYRRTQEGPAVLRERGAIDARVFDTDGVLDTHEPGDAHAFGVGNGYTAKLKYLAQEGRAEYPIVVTAAWGNKRDAIVRGGMTVKRVERGKYTGID